MPLSIPYIGVYHARGKVGELLPLSQRRPFWRNWHNGDQNFLAQPGDKVSVFFRIFSPPDFRSGDDALVLENTRGGFCTNPFPSTSWAGGNLGFRGYGVKIQLSAGNGSAGSKTTDGREIGRVYFSLAPAPEAPRSLDIDIE